MKLCKDCKHHREAGRFNDCHYGTKEIIDPVRGDPTTDGIPINCYTARRGNQEHYCGPEGKYWEAKDAQATA